MCHKSQLWRLKVTDVLPVLLGGLALVFAGHYLSMAFSRVLYPYDLDFIEDAMFMQAWRVAQNQAIYQPPNATFVPQVYMPLYTWVGGWLLKFSGPSMLPLRFLSLTATLITASLLYAIARREGAGHIVAFAGTGIFLAGYRITGGWYDLARVDMLFVALSLLGMALAVYAHHSARGLMIAGVLMGLAFLTKQNGLFLAAVVGIYLLVTVRRRVWVYGLSITLVAGITTLWLHFSTDGWFYYYVFGIAYASPLSWQRVANTLRWEIIGSMTVLVMAFILLGVFSLRQHRWHWLQQKPWPFFIFAALIVTVAGRASVGGNLNNLVPAYTLMCLTPALLAVEIRRWPSQRQNWARLILGLVLLLQFGLIVFNAAPYSPTQFRPTAEMRVAGDRLIEEIASTQGKVLVMLHPYYVLMAGKEPGVHVQTLWHARGRGREPLPADFVTRIENQEFALIISDESEYFETEPALVTLLEANYIKTEGFTGTDAPPTLSGVIVKPVSRYVPRFPSGEY